jgi:signal transduction histidine kinase
VAAQMPALPQELADNVRDISRAAESAALLVGDLRSFAAPSYLLTPGVAINDCVSAAVSELTTERRERLELHLGARLPHLSANIEGLRRSISNLLENAFESGSPTVTVRTRIVDWEPTPTVAGSGLGLPAATGIVREHGGFVGLESVEGEGTIARIFLPVGGRP